MKKLIKVGSDCCGVGAFNQSLIRGELNYKESFACDFDYYARLTFLHNYGTKSDIELGNSKEHKMHADNVKKISLKKGDPTEKENLKLDEANEFSKKFSFYYPFNMYQRDIPGEPLDIYVSSVPCQSYSLAGKRKGKADKRGILFFNSLEFIEKNKPRFFIFENVKGLLSDDKGKTFSEWTNLLGGKSINGTITGFLPYEGSVPYHIHWKVVNAKDHNVPQNRERVFIVGIRDDKDFEFNWEPEVQLTKKLKDVLEEEVDEKYFLSEKMIKGFVSHAENQKAKGNGFTFIPNDIEEPSRCITTLEGSIGYNNFIEDSGFINQDTQASQVHSKEKTSPTISAGTHGYANGYIQIGAIRGRNPDNPSSRVTGIHTEQRLEINKEGTSNTLTTVQKDNVVVQVKSATKKGYEIAKEGDSINFSQPNSGTRRGRVGKSVAQTLDTACNQGILEGVKIRRLTPRECFRLMDFPDSFTWPVSNSQAYKQAGNSIVVKMFDNILKNLNL